MPSRRSINKGFTECVCGLVYGPDCDMSGRRHATLHRRLNEVVSRIGRAPARGVGADFAELKAWSIVSGDGPLPARTALVEEVLTLFFDRSVWGAIYRGYHREHPLFGRYISMTDLERRFPHDVVSALREKYGACPGVIPPGFNYWRPLGSERQEQWDAYGQLLVSRAMEKP